MDAFAIYSQPEFVRRYARQMQGIDNPVFYERLATLELLPALKGLRVLDAGCGPGVYSQWLAEQGASVTALDYSPAMLAELRPSSHLRLLQADLTQALPLPDGCFDVILCAMVLQHVSDWLPVLQEFRRLLTSRGSLVLSTTHPFADLLPGADYFAVTEMTEEWTDYGLDMPCYRRSFGRIWADIQRADLQIKQLLEPKAPGTDRFVTHQPWVLCLKLTPSSPPEFQA